MTSIMVLNGPNLGRLGSREPEIYGSQTLADIELGLRGMLPADVSLDFRQSDDEATLIGWLHEAADARSPVIFNPAAFTHYSYALRDACQIVTDAGVPVIEVHLSNPHARESFRHTSVISGSVLGVIAGFGERSYQLALTQILTLLERH
ncbi:MAG: 3-dehydroquinate dehydratase [Pontimonas sp.]|nr:3-dehydroquinate dehydratase [Pontimonas sp.]